ncbi:MAG: gamma-glutamyl-gamma-aminobutyrate hydrolase family protein [Thermodesulfovibrionales bacterium]|nr:gamma-glutamyl-gamma-aminobutyrate hydrolase family protein [Thermodesulfovibrionales bacterium]
MGFKDRPVIGITIDIDGGQLKLRQEYMSAVEGAGGLPLLISPLSGLDYAAFIDGLLIPGGDDIAPKYYNETPEFEIKPVDPRRAGFEINLFHEIIKSGRPVLGICYGMQLINVALGGTLYQDIESQLGGAVNHKEAHDIEISGGPFSHGKRRVGSTHHQAPKALGRGLEVIARSDDGIVEAFYMEGHPFIVGVQWHPERMADSFSDEIFGMFIKAAHAGK